MVEINEVFSLSEKLLRQKIRPFQRYLLSQPDVFNSHASILTGSRGVGKTTSIIQYLLEQVDGNFISNEILYFPADHFLIGSSSLYEIASSFEEMGGKILCIDEIHKSPFWAKELKSIIDTFPSLKVIASGSSVLEIEKGALDLSRRAINYTLKGLSFREFLALHYSIVIPTQKLEDIFTDHRNFSNDIISKLHKQNLKILPLFKEYLQYGYYPYYLEYNSTDQYYQTLNQGLLTTIESDIPSAHPNITGASSQKIRRLLSILATLVPFTPDLKELRKNIEVGDERTLKIYLRLLEKAEIITTINKNGIGMKELRKPEKIYLNNPNFAYALASLKNTNIGSIRETFFLNALSISHEIKLASYGDFLVDDSYYIEVGGKNKKAGQIPINLNGYLALDNLEVGIQNRIPLWLFGFLY